MQWVLLDSAPVPLPSRSRLSRVFPSWEAEGRGASPDSSPPAPSEGLADGGWAEELAVGVPACLCWTGDDKEKDPAEPLSPADSCRWRPPLSAPVGEWRPGVEGEKGFPGTRGFPPNPGLARGILGDIKEVGVAVSGLLKGEGLLTCWGHVRLGVR